MKNQCPVYSSATELKKVVEIKNIPIYCNVLWSTRDKALDANMGDINLSFCRNSGHFFNSAFDSSKTDNYTEAYENSLHFSNRFNEFASSLTERLVKTYDLHGKDIIDIGCGKGDFLKMICDKGQNRGVGFDRSYEMDRSEELSGADIRFVQDFYTSQYADYPADFISCRHVLEHIEEPLLFLKELRRCLENKKDTIVYFEVPNVLHTVKNLGIWDLIYEHCSYFSQRSLAHVFEQAGFEVLALGDIFDEQFLYIEAKLSKEGSDSGTFTHGETIAELDQYAAEFRKNYEDKVNHWRETLTSYAENNEKAVIWGTGSKGVTFLNVLNPDCVSCAVDLNPHKQGKFVPGTGQRVVGPKNLVDEKPDHVIVMNSIYRDEIEQTLKDIGIISQVICV